MQLISICLLTCVVTAGCALGAAPPLTAAVLAHATPTNRDELRTAVAALLGRPVLLADDALTRSSWLIIEPLPLKDLRGQRLNGRETALPERLQLLISGHHCWLVHERTQRKRSLNAACKPEQ